MSWFKRKPKVASVPSIQERGDKELELLEERAHERSQRRLKADSVCDAQYQENIDSGMDKNKAREIYSDCKFPGRKTGHIVIGGKRWPGRSQKRLRRRSRRKSKRKSTKKRRRKRRKRTKKKRRRRRY